MGCASYFPSDILCPRTDRPYPGGVTSKLATIIYGAMVMPIQYDNSFSPNNSNLKYECYWLYG